MNQGDDWHTTKVTAFFAKLNSAQQNYSVHEIEMLAGVEMMLRHRNILLGVCFCWYTDHKGLIHILNQKNLSGGQAHWLEKIAEPNFEVIYVPGAENILSDALSCLYSNDEPGTVQAWSEYMYHDVVDNDALKSFSISMPLLVGLEGETASFVVELNSSMSAGSESSTSSLDELADSWELMGGAEPLVPGHFGSIASAVGLSSGRKTLLRSCHGRDVLPAETGHSETAAEFAARTS